MIKLEKCMRKNQDGCKSIFFQNLWEKQKISLNLDEFSDLFISKLIDGLYSKV